MHLNSFGILVCALVLVAWGAIWLSYRRLEQRRRIWQAEWG
jgi:hypothetical protein